MHGAGLVLSRPLRSSSNAPADAYQEATIDSRRVTICFEGRIDVKVRQLRAAARVAPRAVRPLRAQPDAIAREDDQRGSGGRRSGAMGVATPPSLADARQSRDGRVGVRAVAAHERERDRLRDARSAGMRCVRSAADHCPSLRVRTGRKPPVVSGSCWPGARAAPGTAGGLSGPKSWQAFWGTVRVHDAAVSERDEVRRGVDEASLVDWTGLAEWFLQEAGGPVDPRWIVGTVLVDVVAP